MADRYDKRYDSAMKRLFAGVMVTFLFLGEGCRQKREEATPDVSPSPPAGSSTIAAEISKGRPVRANPLATHSEKKKVAQDPGEPYAQEEDFNGKSAPVAKPVPPLILPEALPANRKVVALTFDACWKTNPSSYDARVIEILRKEAVPATLLLGGYWMKQFPQQTKMLAKESLFEIGNHSYLHPHMTRLSDEYVCDELRKTEAVLYQLTGKTSAVYRPPYGEYDSRTVKIAADLGMRTLYWSADSGDPDRGQHAKDITQDVLRRLKPGSIVLMHMNGRGWHTAEALPGLIAQIRARGYIFVKASELQNYYEH